MRMLRMFLFVLVAVALTTGHHAAADTSAKAAGKIEIAVRQADGTIVIREENLKKTFPDGGKIEEFKVVKLEDGYNLIRHGHTASGESRTDTMLLSIARNRFTLAPLKWYVTCVRGGCDWCDPNPGKTACECPTSGEDCTFGKNDMYPNQVVTARP